MNSSVVTVTLNPAMDKTVTLSHFEVGGLNRVESVRIDPGGKGINVTKVLKTFGVQVTASGLIAGALGQRLLNQLREKQIETDFCEVNGETRTNLKIIDTETKVTTEINETGFQVLPEDLTLFEKKLSSLLTETDILVLSGSLPPGVPKDIYGNYIRMANEAGVKTILDADGEALHKGIAGKPFAVKPNIFELEQLVGEKLESDQEIVRAGKSLVDKGISLVVISMGSQGSIVLNKDEAFRVKPFPITPQSTVGAGDSMVAVLAYSILQGKSVEDIAKWTTTAGTVTASKPGTQVCTLSEVQQFVDQVHAVKI